jgi:hypothetical protein
MAGGGGGGLGWRAVAAACAALCALAARVGAQEDTPFGLLDMVSQEEGHVMMARGHRMFSCDDPGKLDGLRVARTLDFALCRERHGVEEYCHVCQCEWVRYWQAASACFTGDVDYYARVLRDRARFEVDHSVHCLGTSEEAIEPLPAFSLDPSSELHCSDAARRGAPVTLALLLPLGLFGLRSL